MRIYVNIVSREIRLASRPHGLPTTANFTLARIELAPLQDRQVLVRNLFISVDPYMRGRMNERKSYVPPFELGQALAGGAVGVSLYRANDRDAFIAAAKTRQWDRERSVRSLA